MVTLIKRTYALVNCEKQMESETRVEGQLPAPSSDTRRQADSGPAKRRQEVVGKADSRTFDCADPDRKSTPSAATAHKDVHVCTQLTGQYLLL